MRVAEFPGDCDDPLDPLLVRRMTFVLRGKFILISKRGKNNNKTPAGWGRPVCFCPGSFRGPKRPVFVGVAQKSPVPSSRAPPGCRLGNGSCILPRETPRPRGPPLTQLSPEKSKRHLGSPSRENISSVLAWNKAGPHAVLECPLVTEINASLIS